MSGTTEYPLDTVVVITDMMGDVIVQGSGVLISPDEVLTASHVVYSATYGTASDITVSAGFDSYVAGRIPLASASGTYIHYFPIQDSNNLISNEQSQEDYAVIHLSTPLTGLGTMGLESDFTGGAVNVTGYPAYLDGAIDNSQQFVT